MSIDIKKIQDIKKVDKPWGYENGLLMEAQISDMH